MKKKNTLTLKRMEAIYQEAKKLDEEGNTFIGFIGSMPVYSNPNVPEGVLYVLNSDQFKLI